MKTTLTIAELGARLHKVDVLLMSLLQRRMDLAREVEQSKAKNEDPKLKKIFNPRREDERLGDVHKWAEVHGMNPHFAEAILYTIIGESCKQQMIQMQERIDSGTAEQTDDEWHKELRENLLVLTEKWAETYDSTYEEAFFATRTHREFEDEVITGEIDRLSGDAKVLLDLGCATGNVAFRFAGKFGRTVGYDISPHMIAKANSKITATDLGKISFEVADLENGIPAADHSVSLVVMNLGTASDVGNMPKVLKEISRVLRPHGRFLLSFYNREALLYRWDFIPWQVGLAAVMNTYKNCLDVPFGTKSLSVYARSYSSGEVTDLVKGGLTITQIQSFPTISALLPTDLFEGQYAVQKLVKTMDWQLSGELGGAYLVVTGVKVK